MDGRTHYPAIDGLRAVAVLAILVFHVRPELLPGGFVGVDIFFAISGFVVTRSVMNGPVASVTALLTHFYMRRVMRIVPALVVCIVVTLAVSFAFIPETYLSGGIYRTGIAALLGFSNLVLASGSNNYFDPHTEFDPFVHTWSLGVEEQFYLVVPVLLAGLCVNDAGRRVRLVSTVILVCLTVASFSVSSVQSAEAPLAAFYLLPSRFWELGGGVLLALALAPVQAGVRLLPSWGIGFVALASSASVVAALALARPAPFPVPWAMPAVAGVLGLMALSACRARHPVLGALAVGPMRAIGRISYGLYLWHWPVLVMMRWTVGIDGPILAMTAVALSALLAFASDRLIETPFRRARWIVRSPAWRTVFGGVACLFLLHSLLGEVVRWRRQAGGFSLSVVTLDRADWSSESQDWPHGVAGGCRIDRSRAPFADTVSTTYTPEGCGTEPAGGHRIVVIGDSHAIAYGGAYGDAVAALSRPIVVYAHAGCPFVPLTGPKGDPGGCSRFYAAIPEVLAGLGAGDVLLLASLRIDRFSDADGFVEPMRSLDGEDTLLARRRAVDDAITLLAPLGRRGLRVLFAAPLPVFRVPAYRCSDWFNRMNAICAAGFSISRDALDAKRQAALDAMTAVVAQVSGAAIWDPFPVLCPGPVCHSVVEGRPLFFDTDHLAGYGNRVVAPSLIAALAKPEI